MSRYLTEIKSHQFALTGGAWIKRTELMKLIRKRGGLIPGSTDVSGKTDVLIKGVSQNWSFGEHGLKEAAAAELIRAGHNILVITDWEFRKLAESDSRAKALDRVAGEPIEWLTSPSEQSFKKVAAISGPLDREQTANGRVEQSYLRGRLLNGKGSGQCALCHRTLPASLLVAAHIKPRAECSRKERLDADNIVFLVSQLGCDALYERGLVAVDKPGKIVVAPARGHSHLTRVLKGLQRNACTAWRKENADYFAWHLVQRFQG